MDVRKIDLERNTRELFSSPSPENEKTFKSVKYFPYLETIYKGKKGQGFTSNNNNFPPFNQFETFAHPSLSFKKIFRKVVFSPKVLNRSLRSYTNQNRTFLKGLLEKSPETSEFKSIVKVQPRIVKPLTRSSKLQSLNRSFNDRRNHDFLKINRLTAVNLKDRRKVEKDLNYSYRPGKATTLNQDEETVEDSDIMLSKARLIHEYLNIN
jgi:hypothetical protein